MRQHGDDVAALREDINFVLTETGLDQVLKERERAKKEAKRLDRLAEIEAETQVWRGKLAEAETRYQVLADEKAHIEAEHPLDLDEIGRQLRGANSRRGAARRALDALAIEREKLLAE